MEPVVVYEDEHASIVYGHNQIALGHLKIFPKPKVVALTDLPAKSIAHLFSLATRCASLLFDGLQAQGTNIILNEGKNANQLDDNICIDVIARTEKDGLNFVWQPKQGDMAQIKQIAGEIAGKVIVYEKPPEQKAAVHAEQKPKKEETPAVIVKEQPSPEEFGIEPTTEIKKMPRDEPVNEESTQVDSKKPVAVQTKSTHATQEKKKDDDETLFDKKTHFLLYELMRMP